MVKRLCPIHRYYYVGNECPICRQERVKKMVSRWVTKETGVPKEYIQEKNEVSSDMLEQLKAKFNTR